MAKALFYIPGTSDIYLHAKEKAISRPSNFYPVTEKVWNIIRENKVKGIKDGWKIENPREIMIKLNTGKTEKIVPDKITLPILSPLIDELRGKNLTKVYFFATAQEPPHSKDTIFATKILKRFINERLREVEVEIKEINKNPSDYDNMSEFFEEFVKSHQREFKINAQNYVCITTGTPAQIVSLALGIMQFPVQYIYVSESKGLIYCKSFEKLNKKIHATLIYQLIDELRYSSALNIARNSPLRGNHEVLTILETMAKRNLFDFESALFLARKIKNEKLSFLKEELSELARRNAVYLCLELFYRVENGFNKKNYLEAVACLFSLVDFALQCIFVILTQKDGKIFPYFTVESVKDDFKSYVEQNEELKKYLVKENIRYERASQLALSKSINFILKKSEKTGKFSNIKDGIKAFMELVGELDKEKDTKYGKISLRELRNSGPYAHSTKGLNEELLNSLTYPLTTGGFIEERVKKPVRSICGKDPDNSFVKVNRILKEILDREII